MSKYIPLVREFNEAYGSDSPPRPGLPGSMGDRCRLVRMQLDTEEAGELFHGLAARDLIECLDALTDLEYVVCGTFVAVGADRTGRDIPDMPVGSAGPPRIPSTDLALQLMGQFLIQAGAVSVAFATGDWQAVAGANFVLRERLTQLWAAFRVPEALRLALFEEVHRSNMTKFGADGKPVLNEAGRVVKGPNYEPPNLVAVVERFGFTIPAPSPEPGSPLSGAVLVHKESVTVGAITQETTTTIGGR